MGLNLETKPEHLGWRDETISAWHRELGYDMPAVDIDFLLIEYDERKPKALIDYKHENARKVSLKSANVAALAWVVNRCALPYFIVRYAADLSWFNVVPVNSHARSFVEIRTLMTKASFEKLLGDLRQVTGKNLQTLRRAA